MLATPLRTPPEFRAITATEPKVAVLLNANARRVNERVIRALSHVVPAEDLFLSRSELDARRIAQAVVDRRYDTVFCGGGDGTFMSFVHEILHQVDLRSDYHRQAPPKFGVLKLGTGNGIAALVRASSARGDGILDDVLRARAGEVPGYRRLDLLEVNGKRAHFAGLGIDGRLLNDYIWMREKVGRGALRKVMSGASGYFLSTALRTVPHYLFNSAQVQCVVRNGRYPTWRLDNEGRPVGEPIAPGELVFSGKLMMATAGTIPYFGYELKMFPFAGMRAGHMHLRLTKVGAVDVVTHLPQLWAGKFFRDGVHEFHTREVEVSFEQPMPLQVGGDAAGFQKQITLGVCPHPVELVDFNGAVH